MSTGAGADIIELKSPNVDESDQDISEPRELPVIIEHGSQDESGFSVASVAAVIVAVSIAHFCLTVGGFTGERGWQKLVAVEEWIASLWRSLTS